MLYMKAFMKGPLLMGNVRLFDAILYSATPVCVIKQFISLSQIVSAHETITDSL